MNSINSYTKVEGLSEGLQPTFHLFQQRPAELRTMILHEYLVLEREAGRLSEHIYHDAYGNRCCVWEYPDVLIACDNQVPNAFPPPETARAPLGWLPALAYTNKSMLGEVAVHMLQNTERIDLKYICTNANFKIATWFRKFLAAIPGGDGVNAVKYLNYPHMHWFNSNPSTATPKNPSTELMAACLNLRKVDMTFHSSKFKKANALGDAIMVPCTPLDLVDRFDLRPILECEMLEEIDFDGVYVGVHDPLVPLAKWIMKSLLVRRGQKVEVKVARRWGKWNGRVAGTFVELNDEDMEEVGRDIEKKKGELTAALRFIEEHRHGLN